MPPLSPISEFMISVTVLFNGVSVSTIIRKQCLSTAVRSKEDLRSGQNEVCWDVKLQVSCDQAIGRRAF